MFYSKKEELFLCAQSVALSAIYHANNESFVAVDGI